MNLIVKRASQAEDSAGTDADLERPRFVLSTDTPDLMGDVVVQDGLVIPDRLPAQIDHAGSIWSQVGRWVDIERDAHRTLATLDLLPEHTSKAADLVRGMARAGLRLAASIGFVPEEWEAITDAATKHTTGFRFIRARLLEASVVVTPANPEALALAKRLGLPRQAVPDLLLVDPAALRARERAAVALARINRALLSARNRP